LFIKLFKEKYVDLLEIFVQGRDLSTVRINNIKLKIILTFTLMSTIVGVNVK